MSRFHIWGVLQKQKLMAPNQRKLTQKLRIIFLADLFHHIYYTHLHNQIKNMFGFN